MCTDIEKAKRVIFDTDNMDITAEHVAACIAYPFYGLNWIKINDRYLWDGSLLGNTPLKAVIKASPFKEKRVIVSDTFPRHQEKKLPNNFVETLHRARDILFVDKSSNEFEESNRKKEIFSLVQDMHDIIVSNAKIEDEKLKKKIKEIEKDYNNIINRRGDIINELITIKRNEDERSEHFLLEDWDFSLATIKELIGQGEEDAERALKESREKM
jgi:NTE family protein